jgi:lycopene cyclase domain-containing protein
MTYWGFHVVFTLPLLLAGAVWANVPAWGAAHWAVTAAILAMVMVFTSPWDNYAVAKGIWGFDESRVWRRVGWLPVEEYAFFIIQSQLVIFFTDGLVRRRGEAVASLEPVAGLLTVGGAVLGLSWLAIGWLGRGIGTSSRWHYAWHLLFWFSPVILGQWLVGAHIFLPRLGLLLIPTAVIGTWLTWADFRAVRQGIWFFDEKQITGWKVAGVLPWEEVAFFYLTSLVVAQTWVLLLPEALR